jgi:hypothetical protein
VASSHAADETPELKLKPCTIELVDGRVVEGQLAVQFDMDDHVIVYSPRLATVRSFLKDHVHALTVDGVREQLNAKRDLTDADKKLLGQVAWPDEPPTEGRKPAYTTETWDKPPRLLVWADPGSTGRFEEPKNWLANGAVANMLGSTEVWGGPSWHRGRGSASLDTKTDLLFPASASDYQVRGRRGAYIARHITVESGAAFHHGLNGAYGNLWVDEHGRIDGGGCAYIRGARHSFYVNGERHAGQLPKTPEDFSKLMKSAQYFARKWIIRKDDPQASVTMIGTFRSGDETHWVRGVTILDEGGVFSIGGRTTQTIEREAKVVLKSGTVFGKNGNQLYKDDMRLKGALLVGTPDEPITRDVYLGLSIKDPKGTYPKSDRVPDRSSFRLKGTAASTHGQGLLVAPGAAMQVHTADPEKARFIITWHGITDNGSDDGTQPGYFDELPQSERTTNMVFLDDVQLNDVVLEWLGEGDIRMPRPEDAQSWQRVRFGGRNKAEADAVFAPLALDDEHTKRLAEWREQIKKQGPAAGFFAGTTLFSKEAGTPRIDTPAGHYPAGKSVTVRLSNETKTIKTRYTLDGSAPSANSKLYKAPFTVAEDTVVKAAGFKNGKQLGEAAQARFRFVSPGDIEMIESVDPGKTAPGVSYKYFDHEAKTMPDFDALKPAQSGVAEELSIESVGRGGDKFSLLLEGYLYIDEPGVYNIYLGTAKADACRVYIGGGRIVDNDMDTMDSVGLAGLAKGKHTLRVEFLDNGWGELLRISLRRLETTQKQQVTADMLSH